MDEYFHQLNIKDTLFESKLEFDGDKLNSYKQMLLCHYCEGFIDVAYTCCEFTSCSKCRKSCPLCEEKMKINFFMNKIINSIILKCCFCKEDLLYNSFIKHIDSCCNKQALCKLCNCYILNSQVVAHIDKCSKFSKECIYCKKTFTKYQLYKNHLSLCEKTLLQCPVCFEKIQSMLMKTHIYTKDCVDVLLSKYLGENKNKNLSKQISNDCNKASRLANPLDNEIEIISNRSCSMKKTRTEYDFDNDSIISYLKPNYSIKQGSFNNSKPNFQYTQTNKSLEGFSVLDDDLISNLTRKLPFNQTLDDSVLDLLSLNTKIIKDKEKSEIKQITLINLKISGNFKVDYEIIGENTLDSITNFDSTGVCTEINGSIKLEFSKLVTINHIDILGYIGSKYWNPTNGSHSLIESSLDGVQFREVGMLPIIGKQLKRVKIIEDKAKFIKISNKQTGIGLSYINFLHIPNIEDNHNSKFKDFCIGQEMFVISSSSNKRIKLGTNTLSSISELPSEDSIDKGIVCDEPGYILFELKDFSPIFNIEVRGFWSKYINAEEVFKDNIVFKHSYKSGSWKKLCSGKIYHDKVTKFTIPRYFTAKYIKLEASGPIGISYLTYN